MPIEGVEMIIIIAMTMILIQCVGDGDDVRHRLRRHCSHRSGGDYSFVLHRGI